MLKQYTLIIGLGLTLGLAGCAQTNKDLPSSEQVITESPDIAKTEEGQRRRHLCSKVPAHLSRRAERARVFAVYARMMIAPFARFRDQKAAAVGAEASNRVPVITHQ